MSRRVLAVALALVAAPTLALAQPYQGPPDEAILAAPPADAPPGVCYAHVRVPGATVMAPPRVVGAHWTQSPPPPGAIGPVWCLTPDLVGAHPIQLPDREGWIRVECAPPPRPPCCRRPIRLEDGWLSWHGKRYFGS